MVLAIYGAGGAGREVKEIADLQDQWSEIIFINDNAESPMFKGVQCMPFSQFNQNYSPEAAKVIIALGEPQYKISLYNKVKSAGYSFANVIHPSAIISPSAKLGAGITVKAGVIISADAVIEDNVSLQEYMSVGHDTIIHKHAQISAYVVFGGNCEVGDGTYVGLHVPIKEGIKIGAHSIIGMGSVVVRDIPDHVVAMGNPARAMRACDNSKVFKGSK